MHQHFCVAYIISMESLDLEVVGCLGNFQQFMLNLLDDNIFSFYSDKHVA